MPDAHASHRFHNAACTGCRVRFGTDLARHPCGINQDLRVLYVLTSVEAEPSGTFTLRAPEGRILRGVSADRMLAIVAARWSQAPHGDAPTEAELVELEARARAASLPYRSGTHDADAIYVRCDEGLQGHGGERVLLRANKHFPFEADIAYLSAAGNMAPRLARALREARAEIDALRLASPCANCGSDAGVACHVGCPKPRG